MSNGYIFPAARKIDLFIIGAQKAGTTSLKNYLGEHPDVQTHIQKEFAYFYDDSEFNLGPEVAYQKYFGSDGSKTKLVAKNAGLYVKEEAIRRLHQHNPDCHIVLMLRNPVHRAYSAFQMEKNYGNCTGEFEQMKEVVNKGDESDWRYEFFIGMGMYAKYYSVITKYFRQEQVTIIRYKDFSQNNAETCRRLFSILNVDPSFVPDITVKHNVTHTIRSANYARMMVRLLRNDNQLKRAARKLLPNGKDYKLGEMLRNINKKQEIPEKISMDMGCFLSDFYLPFNKELEKLTGMDFSDWNISAEQITH